ncbi:MAG: hypothetical protein DMG03_29735 [Acidobacteria bacterium]|nr:MAG: hypothetical protein DMG03_29735 [Acidobacteriota bacterium]
MTRESARLVLVVEDDVSVRRPLVKFLEMHGFAVVTAETSDEGLDQLRKNRVVAAVIDLRLRRGSGRDVVMAAPTDVPVIIFSVLARAAGRNAGRDARRIRIESSEGTSVRSL